MMTSQQCELLAILTMCAPELSVLAQKKSFQSGNKNVVNIVFSKETAVRLAHFQRDTFLRNFNNAKSCPLIEAKSKLSVMSSVVTFDRYTGDVKDGVPHGKGRMCHANGDIYDEEWRVGKYHGQGKSLCKEGPTSLVEGTFADDFADGFCKKTWVDGVVFEGNFRDGYRQGHGKITYPPHFSNAALAGMVFEGEYVDDEISGPGKTIWCTGDEFEGNFHGNYSLNGHGRSLCRNKEGLIMFQYEGSFVNNARHGHGCATVCHGGAYLGNWENDMPHGTSTTTYSEGNVLMQKYAHGTLVSISVNGVKQCLPADDYGPMHCYVVPAL